VQGKAKGMLHEMWPAPTKAKALAAYEYFADSWQEKHPRAVDCLREDKEELFAFYDFPRRTLGAHLDDQPV
jgi:putative transposase